MFLKILGGLIWVFYGLNSFNQIPDSLIQLFQQTDQNAQIDRGLEYTQVYLLQDLEIARFCAEKTYELAKESDSPVKITEAMDNLGEVFRKSGDYQESIKLFKNSENLRHTIGADTLLHLSYNLLGKAYFNLGNHDSSVFYFLKAASKMDEVGNLEGKAYYLNNVGVVFDMQGAYEKAIEYYLKSLNIKRELGLTEAFAPSYTNIGIALFNLGRIDESLRFHKLALVEHVVNGNIQGIGKAYNNIGYAYLEQKKYDDALINFKESLKIRKEQKELRAEAQTENNIAIVFLELNMIDSAALYNDQALEIALQIGEKNILKDIYKVKAEIHEFKSDYKLALENYKIFVSYADSISHSDVYESISEMEAKYNLVEKEKEILEKNYQIELQKYENSKQKYLLIIFISIIIGLVISSVLFGISYFRKKRISETIKGQNLLIQKEVDQLERIKTSLLLELEDKKELLDKAFDTSRSQELPEELLQLSKREVEVLACLALGWTDQQIADKLFVSKATVKTHLRRIYSKLLVNSRSGAVAIAHKYQIIGQVV